MKLPARPLSPATEPMPTMVSGVFSARPLSSARTQSAALVKLLSISARACARSCSAAACSPSMP